MICEVAIPKHEKDRRIAANEIKLTQTEEGQIIKGSHKVNTVKVNYNNSYAYG